MQYQRAKYGNCGCCRLRFSVVPANRPAFVDPAFWAQARAKGEVCGDGDTGYIEISAEGLVPLGVYTVFFLTDQGPYPAAPTGVYYTGDGGDPNRLTVNGAGAVSYYVAPLNYNPFHGISLLSGLHVIQGVIINFHSDRLSHGLSPGVDNVNVFGQLVAPICHPHH
ncbi:Hypothetical protein LUCI_0616 [Lucifera butyrica]|uniref:Uncharacterized protein n=1 Tax=Lucifera butyrica TaxID=1351585 RepID=A0A498R3I1_9FIRM|nr:hypothetical protein [Lucifera butyrica]VBB05407.1 Hypothetical protein LUCI_0616 [Lucifera butyrica]